MEVDYKRQGGVTTVPLYDAHDIALLEVIRPCGLAGGAHRPGAPLPMRDPVNVFLPVDATGARRSRGDLRPEGVQLLAGLLHEGVPQQGQLRLVGSQHLLLRVPVELRDGH